MKNAQPNQSDILVVDDNPDDLTVLRSILMAHGYHVRTAINGELALNSVKKKMPNLILLDIRLPGIGGYQVCEQLKADDNPAIADIPVIFISALNDTLNKVKAFSAGGVDYILKPFEQEEIVARIQTHLGLRKAQSDLTKANIELRQEIEERERAENALRENQRMLTTLMGNLPGMAYRCLNDRPWTMQFISEGCLPLTGYQSNELLHNRVIGYGELIHPDDREMVWEEVQTAVSQAKPFQITYRLYTRSGTEKWVWEQGRQVTIPENEHPFLEGFITDITHRVQTEAALLKSDERFKRALENIPDVVVIYDTDLRIQYINNATQQISGRQQSDFIGRRDEDIWPPEIYKAYLPTLMEAAATQKVCYIDTELALPDTHVRSLRITCVPISDKNGQLREILGITHDYTERERAQKTLQESKERFEKVIAQSPIPMVITKANGDIEYFNDTFTKIFGYTTNDVTTAEEWWQLAYPDETYRQQVQESWETAITEAEKSRQQIATQRWDITCKNGTVRLAEFDMMPLGDISVIAMNDVTERKQAEEKLKQSESHYRLLFENVPDGILIANPDSYYLDANPKMCTMLGLTRKEMIGLHATDIVGPQEIKYIELALEQIKSGSDYFRVWQLQRKDGSVFWAEVKVTTMPDNNLLVMVHDITERQEAEEALRQSEARLSVIFNHTTDLQLLWTVEPDNLFRIVAINKSYIEMGKKFGLDIAEELIVGKTLSETVSFLGLGQDVIDYTVKNYEQAAATGEPVRYTENITLKSGTYHSETVLIPVMNESGKCQYILYNSHNITELKHAAEKLRKLNNELDERVRERTSDLNKLVQLMAGREVRMAELKQVIQNLRTQLEAAGIQPIANDPLVIS